MAKKAQNTPVPDGDAPAERNNLFAYDETGNPIPFIPEEKTGGKAIL
jgi:hypothetical protein